MHSRYLSMRWFASMYTHMPDPPFPPRTLGTREGAVVAWLEAERRPVVSVQDVAEVFPWTSTAVHDVLSRLQREGWLRRTARGRYETILAETGGFAPPDPWAALSTWGQSYYNTSGSSRPPTSTA